MSFTPGDRLGPYEIVGTLGAGGMGVVYHARDTRLRRDVAIKILPPAFVADVERLQRFEQEAQALASLNHPHIAQIYGVEGSDRAPALVMEFVEGRTLADRISEGPLACDDAIAIACQIADALDAAHQKGIIHRDLKPANIKLTSDGTVKVLDFGLAKLASDPASSIDAAHSPTLASPATQMGVILGTAAYMAPEQARGRIVDRRADIWAFGCVLYEMLTGRPLFHGESTTDIIASIIHRDVDLSTLPAAVPSNVRALLGRVLQKDPKKRLRDIGDARLALEEPVESVAPVAASITPRRSKAALLALVLFLVGAAFAAGWSLRGSNEVSPEVWTGTRLGGPSPAEFPRVSPDGQTLAFCALVDGLSQVAIMKPDSANWTVLTRDRSRGYATIATWSADGSRLFYDRWFDRTPSIFSVPALGGDERLVLEGAWNPEPLADGSVLVARINTERQVQLHRFWPATGNLVPLEIVFDPKSTDLTLPFRVVGDGRQVAFFGHRLKDAAPAAPGLYVLDIDSGNTRAIGRDIRVRPAFQIGLLPMAAAIGGSDLFIATADDDVFRVFRVPLDGSGAATMVLVLPTLPVLDVTRDGTLYVELRERLLEMSHVGSDGNAKSIVSGLDYDVTRSMVAPLADGRLLVATRTGGREQVLVADAGKTALPLVDSPDETSAPVTALSGERAAFLMGPADRKDIVITSTVDGRVLRRIKAPVSNATSLAASPSGDVLYYAVGGSVYAIPAVGGEPRRIVRGDSLTVDPVSGDLIVKSDEPDRFVLTRVSPDGSDPKPIRISGSFRLVPRALLAGGVRNDRLLLPVTSSDSWYWTLGTVDLRTGAIEKVHVDQLFDVHGATWADDGGVLALTLGIRGPLMRFRRVSSTSALPHW